MRKTKTYISLTVSNIWWQSYQFTAVGIVAFFLLFTKNMKLQKKMFLWRKTVIILTFFFFSKRKIATSIWKEKRKKTERSEKRKKVRFKLWIKNVVAVHNLFVQAQACTCQISLSIMSENKEEKMQKESLCKKKHKKTFIKIKT